MRKYALLFVILLPVLLCSYNWEQYGPSDIAVNSYAMFGGGVVIEVFCTENGIIIGEDEFSYGGLPCWEAIEIMGYDDDLAIVMGNGTDSDGIYGFDRTSGEFTLYHWLMNPRFIKWCPADTSYYAGGEDGLFRSSDGITWEIVPYFNMMYCYDMVSYEDHYVVSAEQTTYYSADAGNSWNVSASYEYITDMQFGYTGKLYGIFPDESWSSGLWSSLDYGETWNVEFWSINMECVGLPCDEQVFTGWHTDSVLEFGLAMWQCDIQELEYFNDGLDNYYINQITTNPIINTPNVLCCTDNGLWMLTNFSVDNDAASLPEINVSASAYPNPFNPNTIIVFELSESSSIQLTIFDIKGRIIDEFELGMKESGKHRFDWNAADRTDTPLASGIYFYQIKSEADELTQKLMLIK